MSLCKCPFLDMVEALDPQEFCTICQSSDSKNEFFRLPCGHSFHSACFLEFLFHNHRFCPNCKATFQPRHLFPTLWKIHNIGISITTPRGLQAISEANWFLITLRCKPPRGTRIESLRFIFHPAFNLPELVVTEPPWSLSMQVCNSNILLGVEVTHDGGRVTTFIHRLECEPCWRLYVEDQWHGLDLDGQAILRPVTASAFFAPLLALYGRPLDYYTRKLPSQAARLDSNSTELHGAPGPGHKDEAQTAPGEAHPLPETNIVS